MLNLVVNNPVQLTPHVLGFPATTQVMFLEVRTSVVDTMALTPCSI